jgi:hypothetical protein
MNFESLLLFSFTFNFSSGFGSGWQKKSDLAGSGLTTLFLTKMLNKFFIGYFKNLLTIIQTFRFDTEVFIVMYFFQSEITDPESDKQRNFFLSE